jgi:hypothetical protein
MVTLRVALTNTGDRPVILARDVETAPWYRLAVSAEDARNGHFAHTVAGDEFWRGDVEIPTFGSEPDQGRFIVVPPGTSHRTIVRVAVAAWTRPGLGPDLPAADKAYWLETMIRTWPFEPMSEADMAGLKRRWMTYGDLATEAIASPTIEVSLPPAPDRCEPK